MFTDIEAEPVIEVCAFPAESRTEKLDVAVMLTTEEEPCATFDVALITQLDPLAATEVIEVTPLNQKSTPFCVEIDEQSSTSLPVTRKTGLLVVMEVACAERVTTGGVVSGVTKVVK